MKKQYSPIGSSFDDFLKEEGIYDEVQEGAELCLLADQLESERKRMHISKSELAKRMGTSRSAVNRLLDPSYAGITLDSLRRAASALGCRLSFSLRPVSEKAGKKVPAKRRAFKVAS